MGVYWITGLSGSGKTILGRKLASHLRLQGRKIILLDGDDLREVMGATMAHSRDERLQLAMRYSRLCHMIAVQKVDVVINTISLFRKVHEWNRLNLPGYIEIFLDVPLSELTRRDPKKIYEQAAKKELHNVAGVDFAVDYPEAPDVLLTWREGCSVDDVFYELLDKLKLLELRDEN